MSTRGTMRGGGRSGAALGIPSRNPLRGLTNATLALSRAVADSTPALAALVLVLLGGYYQHHKGTEAALRGGGGGGGGGIGLDGYSPREGDDGGRLFPNGLFGFGVGDGAKDEGGVFLSSAASGGRAAAAAAPIAFFEDTEVVVDRVVDGDTFVGWFPWAEGDGEGSHVDSSDEEWEYAASPHNAASSASEGADSRDAKRIGGDAEASVPILRRRRRSPSSQMTSKTNRKGKGGKGTTRNRILTKFRLRRIDAPELAQEGGMASKAALERLLLGGELLYTNNKATQPSSASFPSASSDDAGAAPEMRDASAASVSPSLVKQQRMRLQRMTSLPRELTRPTPLLQEVVHVVGTAGSDRNSDDGLHETAAEALRSKEEGMRTPHSVFVVAWERDRYGRLVVDVFITYGLFSGFGGGGKERPRGGGGGGGEGPDGVGSDREAEGGISGGLVFAQAQLVRSGHAWAYAAHYAAHDLTAEEAAARADRVGLWSALPKDPSVSGTSVSFDDGEKEAGEGTLENSVGESRRRAAGEGDEETVLSPSTQQLQPPLQHRPYRNYRYDRVGRLLSGWSPEDGPMPPWVFRALDRAGRLEEVLGGEYFRRERERRGGSGVGGRHGSGRGGLGSGHSNSRRRAGGWSNQRRAAGGSSGKRSTRSGRRHRNDRHL